MIVHTGISVNAGHYYCYVLASDGSWYFCNDNKVQRIDDHRRVFKQNAYILAYRWIEEQKQEIEEDKDSLMCSEVLE